MSDTFQLHSPPKIWIHEICNVTDRLNFVIVVAFTNNVNKCHLQWCISVLCSTQLYPIAFNFYVLCCNTKNLRFDILSEKSSTIISDFLKYFRDFISNQNVEVHSYILFEKQNPYFSHYHALLFK